MNVLALNCGSSSVKFQLVATDLDLIVTSLGFRVMRKIAREANSAKELSHVHWFFDSKDKNITEFEEAWSTTIFARVDSTVSVNQ